MVPAAKSPTILSCGAFRFELGLSTQPILMGVLNVTPDSFSDGGQYVMMSCALARAEQMRSEGATIIDVGGESTRPGAIPISVAEELDRTIPLIEALVKRGIAVSIDTRKPEVMVAAISAGVCLINDINALRAPGALEAAANSQVGVCLMHMQGDPANMQREPTYKDVVQEVLDFFRNRIKACSEVGIERNRLMLDPGFGFGKTVAHNYQLLAQLAAFQTFGLPILVGLSRKSMLQAVSRESLPQDRDSASVAAAMLALVRGARLLRVHNVVAAWDAIKIWQATASFEKIEQ